MILSYKGREAREGCFYLTDTNTPDCMQKGEECDGGRRGGAAGCQRATPGRTHHPERRLPELRASPLYCTHGSPLARARRRRRLRRWLAAAEIWLDYYPPPLCMCVCVRAPCNCTEEGRGRAGGGRGRVSHTREKKKKKNPPPPQPTSL